MSNEHVFYNICPSVCMSVIALLLIDVLVLVYFNTFISALSSADSVVFSSFSPLKRKKLV